MPINVLLLLVLAAVGYLVLPVDVVPDFLPGLGQLDDAAVMVALVYLLFNYVPKHGGIRWRSARDAGEPHTAAAADETRDGTFAQRFASADPYVVLGVTPTAGEDTIKHAYRDLIAQYHPDKVAHLSPEFQALAHSRVIAIQRAYSQVEA